MAPSVQQVARIFEDPEPPQARKNFRRIPSVGDVLRGRRKENSPTKASKVQLHEDNSPSPLGERHINSPPQPTKVPLKDETSRPMLHKRSGSTTSLKDLVLGRQNKDGNGAPAGSATDQKPNKTKSSTNLTNLLTKRSKKDLREDSRNQENVSPTKNKAGSQTPIWEQFATQPITGDDGTVYHPQTKPRPINQTNHQPRTFNYSHMPESTEFKHTDGQSVSPNGCSPPKRPFLEHKSSRSSIFTENIHEGTTPELKSPKIRDNNAGQLIAPEVPEQRPVLESRTSDTSQAETKAKRSSRVLNVISAFTTKSRGNNASLTEPEQPLSPKELDSAFEKVLDARNIPLNMRDTMRNLKPELKLALMRGDRSGSGSSSASTTVGAEDVRSSARSQNKRELEQAVEQNDVKDSKRSRSRSRPRSRVFTLSKRDDSSPSKQDKADQSTRSRSKSRPKSADLTSTRPSSSRSMSSSTSFASMNGADSAITPGDFIHYLREVQKPSLVEIGKLHKLRILLRNESVAWTDYFVTKGGMNELVQLFYRIHKIEWREEHEDNLLHENLLCLKALCTTDLALQHLAEIEKEFFPTLLSMLFDPERKGPSEFSTRGVIISLVFAHLSAARSNGSTLLEARAKTVLGFLKDPSLEEDKRPLDFVSRMHIARPYRVWCKEVVNVTKEVFWIFLHHMNVVPFIDVPLEGSYSQKHFPSLRPPHPAAPYTGGVEWEATQYLANHLDLLNGIIASLPDVVERNALREEMKQSGWEKAMGGTLRICKEKFYSGVHEGLKAWVAAAQSDGWSVEDVRMGPPREQLSPRKSPVKKKADEAPKIAVDVGVEAMPQVKEGWL